MPDMEKLKRGLEAHANMLHPCTANDGTECPYYNEGKYECSEPLARDALVMLLIQENRIIHLENANLLLASLYKKEEDDA